MSLKYCPLDIRLKMNRDLIRSIIKTGFSSLRQNAAEKISMERPLQAGHNFCLKTLKPVFCDFRSKFSLNISGSM
jgi:hypothetical protein